MAVSVETSGISIAELRSRFQQKEDIIVPRNSHVVRNGFNKPTPSPYPTLTEIKSEPIAANSEDIAAVKLRLQKVLKPKPALPPKNNKKEEQPLQTSRNVNEDVRVTNKEEKPVVPRVSIKPNRSHLSTLIAEVQQKCCSPTPSIQDFEINEKEVETVPPPLPPWPTAIKQSKDQVRLRSLPPLYDTGPAPTVPLRAPHVRLPTYVNPTPPLPQRNSEKSLASLSAVNECTPKVSSSPIPEYTEEQELGGRETPDELYGDADVPVTPSIISINSSHSSSHPYGVNFEDDLYHDSFNPDCYSGEIYEDVSNVPQTTLKDKRKSVMDLERERKKQQKEIEKKQREIKKSRERFGLTGEEEEVEVGTVKEDTRTKRKDYLQAKAGEKIYILKISGTPVGKWLVKNSEGKVGYMDLNNIEVKADSIRSVMRQNVTPTKIPDEGLYELYDDGHSEAIYEEINLKKFSSGKS
ncbi:hypothetical protein CHUAL_007569 [Chamberlinius hualienensis]